MSRTVLLCLVLFVGAASAWFPGHRIGNTECDKFENFGGYDGSRRRYGMHGGFSRRYSRHHEADVNKEQVLSDLKTLDADNDGFLTYDEFYNEAAILQLDPSLDLSQGIARCIYTMFAVKRYNIKREVASNIFDLLDSNRDLVVNGTDANSADFNQMDENGDGRVSICEAYDDFLGLVQTAEEKVNERERAYQQLVCKHRKPDSSYDRRCSFMRWW